MIAELTSWLAGGHSSAGADRSPSLLAWIQSTPRQEGFQGRFSTAFDPGDDAPRPGIPDTDHAGGFGGHRALDGGLAPGHRFIVPPPLSGLRKPYSVSGSCQPV
jgi:hypothetical protein